MRSRASAPPAFYLVRAELKTACQLAKQLLGLAENVRDPVPLVEALLRLGMRLSGSETWTPPGNNWSGRLRFTILSSTAPIHLSTDPGVGCLTHAAVALWHLGYPDQALKRSEEALALARAIAHPFSLAFALLFTAWVRNLRKEWPLAEQQVERRLRSPTSRRSRTF